MLSINNNPHIQIGDPAPTFQLDSLDGDTLSLDELLADGRNLVLIFMRHLG